MARIVIQDTPERVALALVEEYNKLFADVEAIRVAVEAAGSFPITLPTATATDITLRL